MINGGKCSATNPAPLAADKDATSNSVRAGNPGGATSLCSLALAILSLSVRVAPVPFSAHSKDALFVPIVVGAAVRLVVFFMRAIVLGPRNATSLDNLRPLVGWKGGPPSAMPFAVVAWVLAIPAPELFADLLWISASTGLGSLALTWLAVVKVPVGPVLACVELRQELDFAASDASLAKPGER